ncbi:MAG: type VII secretion protein EssC [Lawsonibacter sp.]|nr:type VII secretion protein EssC [Lawsonibacter sp.]
MLYAWLYYGDRFKDFYLPDAERWSERLPLWQSESDWDQDYFISVYSIDNVRYISPPALFRWDHAEVLRGDLSFELGKRYTMRNGDYSLGIIFSECTKTDGAFRKYLFPAGCEVSIGRDEGCSFVVRQDIRTVSRKQCVFQRDANGVCRFTNLSKNGTHLNSARVEMNVVLPKLRFGDTVTLADGIKIVFLGDYLAVNHTGDFAKVTLQTAQPLAVKARQDSAEDRSVQIQFHRSPRFLWRAEDAPVKIDPPIEKRNDQNQPLWLTLGPSTTMVLPMLVGSALSSSRGGFMGAGIVMVGTASALAVMWGLLNYNYRKKQTGEIEATRIATYGAYIETVEAELKERCVQERKRLLQLHPNIEECVQMPQSGRARLWERSPKQDDFLSVRLGLGDVEVPFPIEADTPGLSLIDDPLRDEPSRLSELYGTLKDAPVSINFRHNTVIGILGEETRSEFAQAILAQLAALHSYHDVRIAVLSDEGTYSQWSWARWLPHVFASEDRELRMVVSEPGAVQQVITHLDEVLTMRGDSAQEGGDHTKGELPAPHYVVFCTNPELLENRPFWKHLVSGNRGMTLVLLASGMELIPKECHLLFKVDRRNGAIYTSDGDYREVKYEFSTSERLNSFSHMLAPLRIRDSSESAAIPSMVSFLNIYGVRKVESLDVWRLWGRNHVYEGLRSTVGLSAGSQKFVLDISDKAHGPHGLVAGTTGSGKSVMLQTYILSLALNYHPDQIRFILIDYKGGGMADAFRRLPHVTGIIDNLQTGNTIARALASLQGEIHRREKMFKEAGVDYIDDYIRYFYNDPQKERLPHLIIVVDEFAELKADQENFMRELVSASRVGRSLGIHLILATQKPSNSVSDEIWANSNFRICLRVQTRSDSTEMLKKPDAAYLKNRGRCYIQVGNDEIYEQIQTSYSGLVYRPDEPSENELPHLLDNAGQVVSVKRHQRETTNRREPTQMDAVLERIIQTAREHGLPESHHLWLEELPSAVFLWRICGESALEEDLWCGPNDGQNYSVVFGLGDDVQRQKHFPVSIDLIANRNYMVVGVATSGKTTFLQTVIFSFALRYDPSALNMHILSLTSRTLGVLESLPHIGDVIYGEEESEVRRFFDMLTAENDRRKDLFSKASTDSFVAYNQAQTEAGKEIIPAIVVFADRFVQVMEVLGDEESAKLATLLSEGSSRGIFFIVTAIDLKEIPYKMRGYFRGIGLQVNDRASYADIIGKSVPREMPDIEQTPGRGLILLDDGIYEFQTALYGSSKTDSARAAEAKTLSAEMATKWYGAKPARIPRIPPDATWELFAASPDYQFAAAHPWRFPLAYDLNRGVPLVLHLEESFSFLITGAQRSGKTNLLRLIARQWSSRGAKISVLADASWSIECQHMDAELYEAKTERWEAYIKQLNEEVTKRAARFKQLKAGDPKEYDAAAQAMTPWVLLIDDLGKMVDKLLPNETKFLAQMIQGAAKFGIYTFASLSQQDYAKCKLMEPIPTFQRQSRGVVLRGRLSEFDPWGVSMPVTQKKKVLPLGQAWLINNGEITQIVIPKASE